MSIEHGTPSSAGDEESLRQFLDSFELPLEPLDKARTILRRRGIVAFTSARSLLEDQSQNDAEPIEDIQALIALQINEYNQRHKILRPGDRLMLNGNLYGRLTVPEFAVIETQLGAHFTINGAFSELVSMAAPPQDRLYEKYPDLYINDYYNYMAAVRLEDVTVTETIGEFSEVQEYPAGSQLDIPLYIDDMKLERIRL